MSPFIEFTNWYKRNTNEENQIEPYRKYFLLCEGENTEKWYFEELINNRKVLGIHPLIDIRYLERTGEDLHVSNPKRLFEYANKLVQDGIIDFDQEHDKIIIVFDCDIYKNKEQEYLELVSQISEKGYLGAVTNPSFEFFLLLHKEGVVSTILSKSKELLANKKINGKTPIQKMFTEITGINPKKNPEVGSLSINIDIAINQEKTFNRDIDRSPGTLTSNIATILDNIRNEKINI